MPNPISKYIGEDYRRNMGTVNAPPFIEGESSIVPVVIVNPQLPTPKANQQVFTYQAINTSGSNYQVTVSTALKGQRLFLLAVSTYGDGTAPTGGGNAVYDSTSGSPSAADNSTNLYFNNVRQNGNDNITFPLPIEIKRGLRVQVGPGSPGTAAVLVTYMVEYLDV